MPVYFNSDQEAKNAGWSFVYNPLNNLRPAHPELRYKVIANHDMNFLRKFFQKMFVGFLSGITGGKALNNTRIRHWARENTIGKDISEIYLGKLNDKYTPTKELEVMHGTLGEIISNKWGEIKIAPIDVTYKDGILKPRRVDEWDWNWNKANPMRHNPGVRMIDIENYILNENMRPNVLIIGTGRGHRINHLSNDGKLHPDQNGILQGELMVDPELVYQLNDLGIKAIILNTPDAIKEYKSQCDNHVSVAAMIHTTC